MSEPNKTRWGRARDSVAWAVANFALRRIATPWYRDMIAGSIRLGLDAATKADRDEQG